MDDFDFKFVNSTPSRLSISEKMVSQKTRKRNFRLSKKDMVILAILFILPTLLASHSLHYPKTIFAPIIALFSITIFNLILNLFYKSSFHLAGLSGCLTSLWFLIGKYSFFFLPLVPLLSISKKRIGHHTNSQMLVGFLIGIFVTALVFKKMGF